MAEHRNGGRNPLQLHALSRHLVLAAKWRNDENRGTSIKRLRAKAEAGFQASNPISMNCRIGEWSQSAEAPLRPFAVVG